MSANRLTVDVVMDRDVRKGEMVTLNLHGLTLSCSVVGSPTLPLVPLDVSVGDP